MLSPSREQSDSASSAREITTASLALVGSPDDLTGLPRFVHSAATRSTPIARASGRRAAPGLAWRSAGSDRTN